MSNTAFAGARLQTDARYGQRLKIFLPVTLRWAGVQERAHLLDISPTGARMHAAIAPASREAIEIEWEGVTFPGQCVWSRGNRFGITFSNPITKTQIETLLAS